MRVKVLGSAAGGGFPQWNCCCSNCLRIRQGTVRAQRRTQTQVIVSSDDRRWCLLNASPDLPGQIESTPELWPNGALRHTPIAAAVITSGDVDHVLGLLMLRESQPFRVYATESIRKLVDNNIMFGMLREHITWHPITPEVAFQLADSGIKCLPIRLPGNYPHYADAHVRPALRFDETLLGLQIESVNGGGRLVYMSAVPCIEDSWLERLKDCDVLLFDGTFWTDDELVRVRGGGRTATQMGHIPMSGPGGSLQRLAGVTRPRKVYIHINNTNPVLDEDSPEHRYVREAGWEIGQDGSEFVL